MNRPQAQSGPDDLIALFGISGSGKTTLGQILATRLGYHFVDLDWFYKENKPSVRLSNGKIKANWDDLSAIDLEAFRRRLQSLKGGVVVVGFALRDELFDRKPRLVIHLQTGRTPEVIISRAIEARKKSKGFTGDKAKDDELMVREYVYPFFIKNLDDITVNANLDVFENESVAMKPGGMQRRSLEDLINTLMDYIEPDNFSMAP